MHVSVAICTWNRSALLANALDQLCNVQVPPGVSWECIVVNNNCLDATDEVVARFRPRLPLIPVHEPRQGLSFARNAAIDAAGGEYILWTDDDALVGTDWLQAYVAGFRRWPDAAIFGGPIKARFEGTPPQWLSDCWKELAAAYAVRDLGPHVIAFDVAAGRVPYGANYALRTREQRLHRYDPRLGLQGNEVVLGEETAVVSAILRSGGSGWWLPQAEVWHWLPRERQSVAHLQAHYRGIGRMRNRLSDAPDALPFRKPLWLWRAMLERRARFLAKRLSGRNAREWLMDLLESDAMCAQLFDRGR